MPILRGLSSVGLGGMEVEDLGKDSEGMETGFEFGY